MQPLILKVSASGLPQCWMNVYEAVTEITSGKILYSFGEICSTLHGGINNDGIQSVLDLPQILVTRHTPRVNNETPPLTNRTLFARDKQICLYCGGQFAVHMLSRDHIVPISRGGRDNWTNVVTACKRCNNHKGSHLLAECNLELLAIPYTPNRHEFLYLSNRRILSDQMEFLKRGFRNLVA